MPNIPKYNIKKHKKYLDEINNVCKRFKINDRLFKFRIRNLEYFVSRAKVTDKSECIVYKDKKILTAFRTGNKPIGNCYMGHLTSYYDNESTFRYTWPYKIYKPNEVYLYKINNNRCKKIHEYKDSIFCWLNDYNSNPDKYRELFHEFWYLSLNLDYESNHTQPKTNLFDITLDNGDRYIFYHAQMLKINGIKISNDKIYGITYTLSTQLNQKIVHGGMIILEHYAKLLNKLPIPVRHYNNLTLKETSLYEIKNLPSIYIRNPES